MADRKRKAYSRGEGLRLKFYCDREAWAGQIRRIFGENLRYAFICGSAARGTVTLHSDIDLFVCLADEAGSTFDQFKDFYIRLHTSKGLNPDTDYPGEVVSESILLSRLRLASEVEPNVVVRDPMIWDGVVWAGMLCDPMISLYSSPPPDVVALAREVVQRWNKALLQQHYSDPQLLKRVLKFRIVSRPAHCRTADDLSKDLLVDESGYWRSWMSK